MRMIMVIIFLCATHFAAFAVDMSGIINWNAVETTYPNDITLTGPVVMYVPSGGIITLSGNITVTGGATHTFTKAGPGTLILTGTNTYPGANIIEAGILFIGNNTNTGSITGNVEVKAGASLSFYRSTAFPYSGVISGEGVVTISPGAGIITFNGANTYTGITNIYGSLTLGTNGKIESSSNVTLLSATSKLDVSSGDYKHIKCLNTSQAEAALVLGNKLLYIGTNNTGDCGKFSGKITGTGGIIKEGPGKWTIAGAKKDYTGLTTVSGGTLQLGDGSSSGELNNTAGTGGIELNSSAAPAIIRFEPAADIILSKVISGTGSVQYSGSLSKRLKFTGNNTYNGTTTIEAGVIHIGANTSTGAIGGNISVNTGAYLDFDRSDPYTYSGEISGGGSVGKWNNNKIILTGSNTYGGNTDVWGGTLQLGNGTTNGSITNATVMVAAGAILRFEPGAEMIFGKVISGAGSVQYKGSGALYFTANNTYDGTTTVESGALYIGKNTDTGDIKGNISLQTSSCNLIFSRTNEYTYSGVISGDGSVGKQNLNKVILTGMNTYKGYTNVFFGALQIGNGIAQCNISNTLGVVLVDASSKLRFEIPSSYGLNIEYPISGAGSVEIKCGWDITFHANNTYTGNTIVEDGNMRLSATGNIASSSAVRLNSNTAKLEIGGNKTIKNLNTTFANAVVALGANTLTINTTDNTTFAGKITGAGGITKTGNGYFNLTGENTYEGVTTIQEGFVYVGNNTGTSATGAIKGNIVINGSSGLAFGRNTNCEYTGNISGTGGNGVHHVGEASNLTLSGTLTYSEWTVVNSGTLILGASTSLASSSVVSLSGGKLNIISGDKTIKGLDGGTNAEVILGSRTLTIGTSQTSTDGFGDFKGKFTGTGNVIKQGTSDFFMSGTNGTTGNFTASAGTVTFSNKWAGNFIKNAGATLTVEGNATVGGALTLNGAAGPINMNLSGATPSKLTVTGALTATGNPNININPATAPANQVLIQAASGINAANFTLTNGQPSKLTNSADGKQLLLSSTVKTVTVDPQSGTVTAGTGGAVTFPVRTANIGNGAYPVTLAGAPAGVTAANLTIAANAGTLTLTVPASVAANTYTLTITVDGATSPGFSLVVSPAAAVFVTGITVTGAGGATTITTNGGTLQMSAAVTPTNATNQAVTWTVAPASGVATINASGLLTATGNGTVTVRATAKDGSGVYGERLITVSGQYIPTAPTITGPTALSLVQGYAATSTDAYTITGEPAPGVTKTSGNASITWNTSTLRLNIAAGLVAGTYPVTLTASNGVAPDATLTFTLTVTNPTALEVVEQQAFKAWTQNGMLHISGLTPGQSWSVYNLSGQLVYQAVAKTEEAIVPLAAQGVYVVASGGNRVKLIAR